MAIQIQGINTELLLYKTKMERKTPFSDRLAKRVWKIGDKLANLPDDDKVSTKIRSSMLGAQMTGTALTAIAAYEAEARSRKKALMEALHCSEEEIAIDINEFIQKTSKGARIKYYGDHIYYSAQMRKEALDSIDTIWGDAHFEALDSCEYLSSLRSVWGDLCFSRCEVLEGLQVQMVYGDIHAEKAKSTAGLENLLLVGGKIYYQDRVYALEEFQNLLGNEQKGGQQK